MTIADCPRCGEQVSVPSGASEEATVRCPLCREEYALREAVDQLPPALIVVEELGMPAGVAEESAPSWADITASPSEEVSEEDDASDFNLEPIETSSAAPSFDFEPASSSGGATATTVRPTSRTRQKSGSPVKSIIGIVLGGALAFPIAQLILWYLPGDLKRDFGAGPIVAQYVPQIVPTKFQGDQANAEGGEDGSDNTPSDFAFHGKKANNNKEGGYELPDFGGEQTAGAAGAQNEGDDSENNGQNDQGATAFGESESEEGSFDRSALGGGEATESDDATMEKDDNPSASSDESGSDDPFGSSSLDVPELSIDPLADLDEPSDATDESTDSAEPTPESPSTPEPPATEKEETGDGVSEKEASDSEGSDSVAAGSETPDSKAPDSETPDSETPDSEAPNEPFPEPAAEVSSLNAGDVRNAPTFNSDDVKASVTAAIDANVSLDTVDASDSAALKKARQEFYKSFSALGEVLTFADQSDEAVSQQLAETGRLLNEIGQQPDKLDLIGKVAAGWLRVKRPTDGILLYGTVQEVAQQGEMFETRVQLDSNDERVVSLISISDPSEHFQTDNRVLALGTILEEPGKNLGGYNGDAELVVLDGRHVAFPTE